MRVDSTIPSGEIKQNMILEVLKCTLNAHRINNMIKAEDVYAMIDSKLMQTLKE